MEMGSEPRRDLAPCFPQEQWVSQRLLIQYSQLLRRYNSSNNVNQMYLLSITLSFPLEKSLPGIKESLVIISSNCIMLH